MKWAWGDQAVHYDAFSGTVPGSAVRTQALLLGTFGMATALSDQNRSIYLKRIIVKWAGQVALATVNTVFKLLWTYYVRNENDSSQFGATSEFSSTSDIHRDILFQDQRMFHVPAAANVGLNQGGAGDLVHDFRPIRKLGAQDVVVCTVGFYRQIATGWELVTVTPAANTATIDATVRVGVSIPP